MRTTRNLLAITGIVAMGIGALAGCSTRADDGAGQETDENGRTVVKYAAGAALVTDWDVFVAEDQGYFADHGIAVDNVKTQTAEAANQLLQANEVNVGRGLPASLNGIIGSGGEVELADVADTLIRAPFFINGIDTLSAPEDIADVTVGSSSKTDSTTIVTKSLLADMGIDWTTIEMRNGGGTADRLAGLKAGELEAALLLPPLNYEADDAGYPSVGYVPDVVDGLGENDKFAFAGVIVNPEWASENSDTLVAYLAARGDALAFLADPANKDEAISILSEATGASMAAAEKTYDDLHIATDRSAFASEIGIDEDAANGVLDGLKKAGDAGEDFTIDEYLDDSYAAEARDAE